MYEIIINSNIGIKTKKLGYYAYFSSNSQKRISFSYLYRFLDNY